MTQATLLGNPRSQRGSGLQHFLATFAQLLIPLPTVSAVGIAEFVSFRDDFVAPMASADRRKFLAAHPCDFDAQIPFDLFSVGCLVEQIGHFLPAARE